MSAETVLFIFGCVLIFIAIVGGGFEAKELKIGQVNQSIRAIAALVGLIAVGLGMWLHFQPSGSKSGADGVTFNVVDNLSTNQIEETAVIEIDGKVAGTIKLDSQVPRVSLPITLPTDGSHNYHVRDAVMFENPVDHTHVILKGEGQGTIDVRQGSLFMLRANTIEGSDVLTLRISSE